MEKCSGSDSNYIKWDIPVFRGGMLGGWIDPNMQKVDFAAGGFISMFNHKCYVPQLWLRTFFLKSVTTIVMVFIVGMMTKVAKLWGNSNFNQHHILNGFLTQTMILP